MYVRRLYASPVKLATSECIADAASMRRTVRTLVILFALPPVALLLLAQIPVTANSDVPFFGVIIMVVLAMVAAITTSGWSRAAKVITGALYTIVAFLGLPMVLLFFACLGGDCL